MLLTACSSTASPVPEPPNTGQDPIVPNRPSSFANDDAFLDYIQKVHFNYMWEGAEPTSGLAPERIHYLTKADRFHGVWPHWLNGPTGKVVPFGQKDNGGDLVESCFMMQSLLCVREYFKNGNADEKALAEKINVLWHDMDFDWYRNGGKDVIYWHWSPEYGWEMNFPLEGYNECMIVYILAAASPTHSVPASCYHKGWARNGAITTDAAPYGHPLLLKHNGAEQTGGPPLRRLLDRHAQPCAQRLRLLRG